MPTELIDLLAGLNVTEAVFLALGLFGAPAALLLLALNEHVRELLVLRAQNTVDKTLLVLLALVRLTLPALEALARRLDPATAPAPRKGHRR